LGNGAYGTVTVPVKVNAPSAAAAVAAGAETSCAIMVNGSLWCWGDNLYGEVGTGSITTQYNTPQSVSGFSSGAAHVSLGITHTCASKTDGSVWCWGSNDSGQLGDGTMTKQTSPKQVAGFNDVTGIATGGPTYMNGYACAVRADGSV